MVPEVHPTISSTAGRSWILQILSGPISQIKWKRQEFSKMGSTSVKEGRFVNLELKHFIPNRKRLRLPKKGVGNTTFRVQRGRVYWYRNSSRTQPPALPRYNISSASTRLLLPPGGKYCSEKNLEDNQWKQCGCLMFLKYEQWICCVCLVVASSIGGCRRSRAGDFKRSRFFFSFWHRRWSSSSSWLNKNNHCTS